MDQNQSFSSYSSTPPQVPQNPNPVIDTMVPVTKPKKVGPIVAILVAVLIVIAVAVYFVSKQFEVVSPNSDTANATELQASIDNGIIQTTPTPEVQAVTNTKDDIQSLEQDLNASLNGLDAQQI